ncbi:uncharacterized protein LOC133199846 [Saccostrea echinata]|uniref:uncharacterized protein LOC133199846 n=1 Tax=Saccostrea echinata TaxID=191078 RepID=UPI002A82E89B|nr:uncharacterized protein LOC133199846 [Saccostrea echinata]
MKVEKIVDNLLHILQQSNLMARSVYLPTQQMMEHLLVKLMGAKHLYKQTTKYCFTAYIHLKQQLSIGTLVPQNLTLMALISRLWVLAKTCLLNCTRWYGELYPCLEVFVPTVHPWLPDGVVLPNTIAESDDEPEPLDLYQSNTYQEKYMESVEPKKIKYFIFQRDIVEEDREGESYDEDNNWLSDTNDESQITSSPGDRNKVTSLHKDTKKGCSDCFSKMQQSEIGEDEGEPVSRVQHLSIEEIYSRNSSEDEGEPVSRDHQISSEDEGEPISRVQHLSIEEIYSRNSSEDEGEPVSRDHQISSEDEGEPVPRIQHMSRNKTETHLPNSRKGKGEPAFENVQQQNKDPQYVNECKFTDSGPSVNVSKRKIPKVKNDQGHCISGAVCGMPEITGPRQMFCHLETKERSMPQVFIDNKAVRKCSFEELITILNDLPLVHKEEKNLVQTYIKSLKKLKHESHKNVHPLRQNKKLKSARKLVLRFSSDLDQLRIVYQEQEEVKRKVKEQRKITNTPSRLVDGYVAPKSGKKRKQDFNHEEWGESDGKNKKKKGNEEGKGQTQDNHKTFSTSKENRNGFLKLVKQWKKSVEVSSTVTLQGLVYDLSNPAKRRKFLKKLKIVKWKFLNRELTEEESIRAIDSQLISL